jgi:hypothetical protein
VNDDETYVEGHYLCPTCNQRWTTNYGVNVSDYI